MIITADALDLAGADGTDHVPHSLGDGSLKHLVQLAHVHAEIVDIVAVLVHVEDH